MEGTGALDTVHETRHSWVLEEHQGPGIFLQLFVVWQGDWWCSQLMPALHPELPETHCPRPRSSLQIGLYALGPTAQVM